ncbi:MAG TPA: Rad52/Rad22 family DNA repair protein [Patescibacteria group bacterium]|nr:Rad52/Rad22 family DNA repair protein [Patescibacteria group bacterium]
MDKLEMQSKLAEKFPVAEVKQREGGFGKKLDYIPIDGVINRLNEVLPMGYSWSVDSVSQIGDSIVVVGTLGIKLSETETIYRAGVGSDVIGKDMDKTVKTAYAEALKKSCNTLGIGLYLWDAEERADIARERQNGGVETKRTFSSQQLEKMKFVRTKLKLTNDEDLNKFLVETYKEPDIKTKADFTSANINKFLKFAEAKTK